jgi:ABC-2 type transport system permease protein
MQMSNFWITVAHTAEKRLKSKAFIWSTIIISVIVIGLMNIGTIVEMFTGDGENAEKSKVAIVSEPVNDDLADLLHTYEEAEFNYVNYTDGNLEKAREAVGQTWCSETRCTRADANRRERTEVMANRTA